MTDNRQQTTDLRPKTKIERRILNGQVAAFWRVTNHKPVLSAVEGLRTGAGSALILAVVLTSLLAVLGVMFVMIARVDRIATSAISENKDLNSAVEAVIAKISQELVLDVPGMSKGREYYDYPDVNNAWLANLEPHKDGGYKWRQISDIYNNWGPNTLEVKAEIIPDYQESKDVGTGSEADADGDGVADSRWVELDDITSNKGKPVYAAVRVIDNGAMLNVNTAYKFDPTESRERIDGSSQMQINLAALSQRGSNGTLDNAAQDLHDVRCGGDGSGISMPEYEQDVVRRYYVPAGEYTPFDLSDELELRYRFMLNEEDVDSRIEEVWDHAFQWPNADVPVGTGKLNFDDWLGKVQYDASDPNAYNDYSYRHIGTIYNMDRIIEPDGGKMLNINDPCVSVGSVYETIKTALGSTDPNFGDVNDIAAQIAVNLIDYRDGADDPNVTTLDVDGTTTYYGFERPCVYISELAHRFVSGTLDGVDVVFRSYAIELHKPYPVDDYPDANQWRLIIDNSRSPANDVNVPVDWSGTKHFHVIKFQDPCAALTVNFNLDDKDEPNLGAPSAKEIPLVPNTVIFDDRSIIELQRLVDGAWLTVDDNRRIPRPIGDWLQPDVGPQSIQRDITLHKCIRRLWDSNPRDPNLGRGNSYIDPNSRPIQAHPANEDFTNVGEIGMIFRKGAYYKGVANRDGRIGYGTNKTEADVRIDLIDRDYHNLFQYLTVFDPTVDGINNDGDEYAGGAEIIDESDPNKPEETPEFKIPGRININTAPWFVIAQLPWMQYTATGDDYQRTQKIVDSRTANGPYSSIGGLMRVMEMRSLGSDDADNLITDPNHGPDLTLDYARDDFEERDVIFARISNLVTVRSDVFTAYILVRVGADGPQKRVIAILDRSDVYSPNGKVRIVALHPVADPR